MRDIAAEAGHGAGTDTSAPRPPRGWAAAAGAICAAVAVATVELLAGVFGGIPSLIVSIGDVVIRFTPGWLERAAIGALGTADKPTLVSGVVVVALAAGALLGIAGLKHFWIAVAGFSAFGVIGVAAAAADPDASVGAAVIAVTLGLVVSLSLLNRLLALLRPSTAIGAPTDLPGRQLRPPDESRRAFLRLAGGAAAAAGVAVVAGRWLSSQASIAAARLGVNLPAPASTVTVPAGADLGIAGLTPYVMPNARFYRIDTALRVPRVDPANWRMRVTGMVDRPFELTYDELLDLATVEEAVTLSCVSNEVGDSLVGNAVWQGVPLRDVLDRAGIQDGATQIVGRSVDGFTAGFPTEIGMTVDGALVAVGMNGEALPNNHGFPARLVIPGLYGYVSATKWLSAIELTTFEAFDGYWITRGWSKLGPIKTQSRIDVPRHRAQLSPGPVAVAGIAWAPTRGIGGVQVSVDGGEWNDARLAEVVGPNTWRQWVFEWEAIAGEHELAVRASDDTGEFQTAQHAPPFPDGATGHHTVSVVVM